MGLPLGYPIPTTVVPAVAPSATPAPTPIPTALSSADATDTNPAAIRAFLLRLLDSTRRALSGARPWSELADRSVLSRLDSLAEATSQLRKNLAYFRVNYDAVVALSLAAALLAHPFSLAAWSLLYVLCPADVAHVAAFGRTFWCSVGSSPHPRSSSSSRRRARSSFSCSRSGQRSCARTARAACLRTCFLMRLLTRVLVLVTRCCRSSPPPPEEAVSDESL